ncbi:MAG: hypothetical protein J0M02_16895, partial [Planctomycetes bacterium]|nr:hypothetical protein [Planctomycetota bacterium]
LAEIGYNVFAKDRSNEGIYDLQTKNCVKAFKNHYMNKSVVAAAGRAAAQCRPAALALRHRHPFQLRAQARRFRRLVSVRAPA